MKREPYNLLCLKFLGYVFRCIKGEQEREDKGRKYIEQENPSKETSTEIEQGQEFPHCDKQLTEQIPFPCGCVSGAKIIKQ